MKQKSSFFEVMRGITDVAQFGLSIIAPVILCGLLGLFLKNKFSIPDIFVVLLILLGFASGISSAVSFIKSYLRRNLSSKEKEELLKNKTKKRR
ncbi:MAG: AtpZ/AtpI family protein [Oscillospiraceae bacterium]